MKNRIEFFRIIPFIYLLVAPIWVFGTDYLVKTSNLSSEEIYLLETMKGLFFIVITAALLYVLLRTLSHSKKIEEEKEKLTLLINTMPDLVTFKDGEGNCIELNKFGAELFELENFDCKGKSTEELAANSEFYHDALISCIDTDEEAWKAGKMSRCEETIPTRDGYKTFDSFKVPIFHKDGSRKALLVIGRDITNLKETENMLRQSEKMSVVGELAAGIAHEIRNPLTTIKGFMQMHQEKTINVGDHIDVLVDEIDRINSICTDLLLVAKPTALVFANKNVNAIVKDVLQLLSTEAKLKNTKINLIERDQCDAYCNDSQLKQVFINVLKNALDAITTNGEVKITIEDKNEQSFAVKFEDNGCGIDATRLKHIGEPFYSVKEKGIGLGMTVSYRIMETHNGSIIVSSQVNVGTTVEILLPKSKA